MLIFFKFYIEHIIIFVILVIIALVIFEVQKLHYHVT